MSEYSSGFAHLIERFVDYRKQNNKWRSKMSQYCLRSFDRSHLSIRLLRSLTPNEIDGLRTAVENKIGFPLRVHTDFNSLSLILKGAISPSTIRRRAL